MSSEKMAIISLQNKKLEEMLTDIREKQTKCIFNNISNDSLFQLKTLNLFQNEIESMEGISRFEMPHLEQLLLGYNRISCLREFRKVNLKKLHQLGLHNNKVCEGNELVRMLTSENMLHFHIDFNFENTQTIQDISCILKLEAARINIVYMKNKTRIKQERVKSVIRSKYNGVYG